MTIRRRKGQALVEFALVVPVFLALLMGVVDVGWLYNHQLMLTNAAREGARMAALGQTVAQIRANVKSYLADSGFTPVPTDAQIAVTIAGGTAQVVVSVDVPTLFGLTGPDATLKGSTKMRTE